MYREPPRHKQGPQRDERNDKDGETDSSNSLRDGDCARDAEDLKADEEHNLAAADGIEWVVALEEAAFGDKVEGFG